MSSPTPAVPISKTKLWTGRALSFLPGLFLLVSGVNLTLIQTQEVRESFAKFGYPASLIAPIGIIEALCAVLYLIPRTSVLGAILLTGYLGGAVATHVRVNDPTFIAPLALGVLLWAGLFLREERLHSLIPIRR
jgi:DoxX-like family